MSRMCDRQTLAGNESTIVLVPQNVLLHRTLLPSGTQIQKVYLLVRTQKTFHTLNFIEKCLLVYQKNS